MIAQSYPKKTACVNSLVTKQKPNINQVIGKLRGQDKSIDDSPTERITDNENKELQQQINGLQASISSFKNCLNQDVELYTTNKEKEFGEQEYDTLPDRSNLTIQEENEQAEMTQPDEGSLELFYNFLSLQYLTTTEKLAYFQQILKMERLYKAISPKKSFRLKFEPEFLCYFSNLWLESMGFGSADQQRKLIDSIVSFSKEQLSRDVVEGAYRTLFGEFLPPHLHMMLVINVCRYGWQYLIFFAGRFFYYVRHDMNSKEFDRFEHQKKIGTLIKRV